MFCTSYTSLYTETDLAKRMRSRLGQGLFCKQCHINILSLPLIQTLSKHVHISPVYSMNEDNQKLIKRKIEYVKKAINFWANIFRQKSKNNERLQDLCYRLPSQEISLKCIISEALRLYLLINTWTEWPYQQLSSAKESPSQEILDYVLSKGFKVEYENHMSSCKYKSNQFQPVKTTC